MNTIPSGTVVPAVPGFLSDQCFMCEIKRSGRARPSESESPQIKHTSGHVRQSHDSFWLAQRSRGKGESHRRTAITCDPVCVYDLLCWRRPLISNIHIAQNLFTFLQAAPSCPPSSASTSHPSTRYTLLFFRPPALHRGGVSCEAPRHCHTLKAVA